MESTTGAAETLSSNRHPTARSPVSAGHKRITDTLPTVNPRLRAPLPPAAIAPARAAHRHASRRVPGRHPRRDFSSSVLHSRGHHSPSPGVKDNRKTTKNTSTGVSRQSRLYCGDAAAVRTLRWQHSSPRRPPPSSPVLVTVRRGHADRSPAPVAEGAASTPHSRRWPWPQAAVLSLLHRGRRGPRDAERRKATAARS